jgi:hypothetical protein
MAIKITTTKRTAKQVRLLVYGESGIGKTRLIATAPDPLIVSSEQKALSLRDYDIPFLPVSNFKEAKEAFRELAKGSSKPYKTICIDSITHLAEVVLAECKKHFSDGRQAYGELATRVRELIELILGIPDKNIYMIAKIIRQEDEFTNLTTWCPSMPGQTLTRDLPYYFDLYCPLKEGTLKDNTTYKYLQTEPDLQYRAKGDNSCLSPIEEPDLTKLFNKILRKKNV